MNPKLRSRRGNSSRARSCERSPVGMRRELIKDGLKRMQKKKEQNKTCVKREDIMTCESARARSANSK